jgi:hypothetical protein
MEFTFMPTDLCVNVALLNGRVGVWQLAQPLPKWLAGGLWQELQFRPLVWLNAHDVPARLWQLAHAEPRPAWFCGAE